MSITTFLLFVFSLDHAIIAVIVIVFLLLLLLINSRAKHRERQAYDSEREDRQRALLSYVVKRNDTAFEVLSQVNWDLLLGANPVHIRESLLSEYHAVQEGAKRLELLLNQRRLEWSTSLWGDLWSYQLRVDAMHDILSSLTCSVIACI